MNQKKFFFLISSVIILGVYYLWQSFGHILNLEFVGQIFLLGFLVKITDQNMREKIYEDELTLLSMGAGIFVSALVAFNVFKESGDYFIFVQKVGLSICGLFLGGFCFYALGRIGDWISKKESLGGGDVKLAAAIGSFVGPTIVWFLPIWFVVMCIFALIYKVMGEKEDVSSPVPTILGHFVALVILLSIQAGVFNILTVLLGFSVLFLGADYLFVEVRKSGGFSSAKSRKMAPDETTFPKSMEKVKVYNFQTKRTITIPMEELAPGMVEVKISGLEGTYYVDSTQIISDEYRHPTFKGCLKEKIDKLRSILVEVRPCSYEAWEDGFRRDKNPEREIDIWLNIANKYQQWTENKFRNSKQKKEVFTLLHSCMTGAKETVLMRCKLNFIDKESAQEIIEDCYSILGSL